MGLVGGFGAGPDEYGEGKIFGTHRVSHSETSRLQQVAVPTELFRY